jgi:hypothetical protein
MAHTIRLVDGTTYAVESTEIVNDHLEIVMSTAAKSVENIEAIFDNQASNIARIGVEQPEGEEYGHFSNFTKYGGIFKNADAKTATVYLIQPVDATEQRIATAESVSAEAKSIANNALSTANGIASTANEAKQTAASANENATAATKQVAQVSAFTTASFIVAKKQAQSLTDQEALQVKSLYDEWADLVKESYVAQETGFKFAHTKDGVTDLYKTMQANFTFQGQWEPGAVGTESLYSHIDEAHAGTEEDPIPYKKNMEIFNGKYYTYSDVLYRCTRDSGIPLQHGLDELVGLYVVVAE